MCVSDIEDFKGDSSTYQCTVTDDITGLVVDITTWKLECEIWDNGGSQIKKATANVTGGSDLQIKITNGPAGEFEIYIDKSETVGFESLTYIEIAMFVNDQKDTIYRSTIDFSYPKIGWESI